MKIVLLAGADSIHTVQWVNRLASIGHEVFLISQHTSSNLISEDVKVHILKNRGVLGYFLMVPKVRKLISNINPDIINAHYASGYGTTARLINFHPYLLSVWGSDVFIFPKKSFLHKLLIRNNILSADLVASTSQAMAGQVLKIVPELKNISITPFGVNIEEFKICENDELINHNTLTIGTIKSMNFIYGIDILLEAFSILIGLLKNNNDFANIEVKLRLVGGGEHLGQFKQLAFKLGIENSVEFVGPIRHSDVPQELSKFDVFVALSRSESFGVAVIEAGAAGKPVVVTDVGGLPEVVIPNKTGIIVKKNNPLDAAKAIEKLLINYELRKLMGNNAQEYISNTYSWDICLNKMIVTYNQTIQLHNNNNQLVKLLN